MEKKWKLSFLKPDKNTIKIEEKKKRLQKKFFRNIFFYFFFPSETRWKKYFKQENEF